MSRSDAACSMLRERLALVVERAGQHAELGGVDRAAHRGGRDAVEAGRGAAGARKHRRGGKAGGGGEKAASVQHWHRSCASCRALQISCQQIIAPDRPFSLVNIAAKGIASPDEQSIHARRRQRQRDRRHRRAAGQPAPQSGDAEGLDADRRRARRRCAPNWRRPKPTADRERIALVSRDLRYWNSPARKRRAFGARSRQRRRAFRHDASRSRTRTARRSSWKIVGEDEADAAHGTISHVSPMAVALFGKKVGDTATVNGKEWEIVQAGGQAELAGLSSVRSARCGRGRRRPRPSSSISPAATHHHELRSDRAVVCGFEAEAVEDRGTRRPRRSPCACCHRQTAWFLRDAEEIGRGQILDCRARHRPPCFQRAVSADSSTFSSRMPALRRAAQLLGVHRFDDVGE